MQITRNQIDQTAKEVISSIAGADSIPRDDQLQAVYSILLENRRTLVVQRTGWGKSAVYWISAKVLKDTGGGITFVISPLLALMRNQVESAKAAGLSAVTLNSSNTVEWDSIESRILSGNVDVVFVSPERLANPGFVERILKNLFGKIGLLVIDEAHCISSWGHDFRPDYQRIAKLLTQNPSTPVLCTTATANLRVTRDIATQLGEGTLVLRGQLARESLHLSVERDLKPAEHYSWVSTVLDTISGSGIIYTLTVDKVNKLSEFLKSQGHNVEPYFGAVPTEQRIKIEDALMANQLKAVVATSALGMGYDKPDLAFCIHVGCPGSPVDYYQQVGRAGRALEKAPAILVTDQKADKRIWEWFATSNIPKPAEMAKILQVFRQDPEPMTAIEIGKRAGISRNKLDLLLKILAVDGALERTEDGWVSINLNWEYDQEKYSSLLASRRAEARNMATYALARQCLETQLRLALDDEVDPEARCLRCSVCTGTLPENLPAKPAREVTARAIAFLKGVDNVIETRTYWPPAGIELKGIKITKRTISPGLAIREGRALAYGDDAVWDEEIAAAFKTQTISENLAAGIEDLLQRWKPNAQGVTFLPSYSRPLLVQSLAELVAEKLEIELFGFFDSLQIAPEREFASQDARAELVASRVSPVTGAQNVRGSVLLIDDFCFTRWTLTVAGAYLRDAGAADVLPFVLHHWASSDTSPGS